VSQQTFNNLRYRHICELLDILSAAHLDRTTHIKRLFAETAEGFEEVVAFLSRLGVVAADNRSLHLRIESEGLSPESRQGEIMRRLLDKRNRYRSEVFRFVNQFKVAGGDINYLPSDEGRSAESGVRNFLMDLGIVEHDMATGRYVLVPEFVSLLASAKNNANYTSPSLLENRAIARNELGLAAEELVVEYERSRIGPRYADKVDHVSVRNCAAGYDIRSVSVDAEGLVSPRFIEVKAVSPTTFQFYWSRNEVSVARALAHWYNLYLLPVNRHGQFDIDRLKVIADPCDSVLSENSNWVTEADALICYSTVEIEN